MKPTIDKIAKKIVDNDYNKSKNKSPFTHAAGNLRDHLKYTYNPTTGKMDNRDGGETSMIEAVKMNETLDKNFQDQKTDDYIKKLKHFGIEHSQTKHPDYPKVSDQPILKNNINNKKFNETPKQTWNRLDEAEKERQQKYRRQQHYLKTWGIQDGPHNPDLRNIIRKAVNEADAEKKNNPTVNRYKEFKEKQKQKIEDKKFKEDFDKEYGEKAIGQHIRKKEYANKKAGKAPYEDFSTSDIIVAEDLKDKAKKKIEAIKASGLLESKKPEDDYLTQIEYLREDLPAPMPTLKEWINTRAPAEEDPPGITGIEKVKDFKNNISLTNLRFPKRSKGLGPLLGEED